MPTVKRQDYPRLDHDREVSALYVTLNNLSYHHGLNLNDSCRVDFAEDGTPIGVEVLGLDWTNRQESVWLIESGEYEQRGVFGVAESLEAAIAHVKTEFGPPYIVRWEQPKKSDYPEFPMITLTGHFEAVPGYSTEHTADYDITECTVARLGHIQESTACLKGESG